MLQNNKNLDPKNLPRNSSKSRKFYIETYGCQMNVYDSELVGSLLNQCGYNITNDIKLADVIFLNTCEYISNFSSVLLYLSMISVNFFEEIFDMIIFSKVSLAC